VFLIASCRKDFGSYYDRPATLADPIYQQLKAKGNFTNLVACIEKAGYQESLSGGGYWTFFAPDDAAFEKFYAENGISGISDPRMDTLARKIVNYSLVYNAYRKGQLSLYQASAATIGAGANPNIAFKRKTAYYDFVYKDKFNNKNILVVAANRNGGSYIINDNGNKYLPYFVDTTFMTKGLTASDYNAFYPNTPYTGFNVVDARVTQQDIPAENGIIHVIDKVLTPLPNLDQYIASKSEYSGFKALLDKAVTYFRSDDLTKRANAVLGTTDSVYIKFYASYAIAPNNENFINGSTTDAQQDTYTMFVPKNAELKAYTDKILKYYNKSFDNAPRAILLAFINSHMWKTAVWPKQLTTVLNSQDEPISFSAGNVVEKKVLSNGFFYGTNAPQEANVFRTVYGNAFLDPKYSLMTMAIDAELKPNLIIPTTRFTVFMMSDAELAKAGISFSQDRNLWGYQRPGSTSSIDYSTASRDRIMRILNSSVVSTLNGELNDLSGEGIIETYNGEYIKYKQNKLYASYNEENNTPVTIDSTKDAFNGKVYYTTGLLQYTENNVGFHLSKLATADATNFGSFFTLLNNSSLYNAADNTIAGVSLGVNYTIFVPTNAAIQQAATDGYLPKNTNGTVNLAPTTASDRDLVEKFIKYHIIDKSAVAITDTKPVSNPYQTLLKNVRGETLTVSIASTKTSMTITDNYRTVNANYAKSNNLSNRTLIHSITSYLKYNDK